MPKSEILMFMLSLMRQLRAARSLWTILWLAKYAMPSAICTAIAQTCWGGKVGVECYVYLVNCPTLFFLNCFVRIFNLFFNILFSWWINSFKKVFLHSFHEHFVYLVNYFSKNYIVHFLIRSLIFCLFGELILLKIYCSWHLASLLFSISSS